MSTTLLSDSFRKIVLRSTNKFSFSAVLAPERTPAPALRLPWAPASHARLREARAARPARLHVASPR
jgi:hypothetical protein